MYVAFFWMQGSTAWMLSLLPLSVSKLILIVMTALQLLVWCHHNEKFPLTEARSKIVARTKSGRAESSVLSLTSRANKHWCLQCRGIHPANTWLLLRSRALRSCLDGWVTACKASHSRDQFHQQVVAGERRNRAAEGQGQWRKGSWRLRQPCDWKMKRQTRWDAGKDWKGRKKGKLCVCVCVLVTLIWM